MLNRLLRIFLFLVLPLSVFGQNQLLEEFKTNVSTFPHDSLFQAIDDKLLELDSTRASDAIIIELLEFKLEKADSFSNRVIRVDALQKMAAYSSYYESEDYYQLLKKLGSSQHKIGNIDEAMETYFSAADLADSLKNDTLRADIYRTIGVKYKNQQIPELALKYLNQSIELSRAMNDSLGILNCYMTIGNAYKQQGREDSIYLDTALYYYNQSILISKAIDYKRGEAGNYNNIGNVLRIMDRYDESLEYYFMALELNQNDDNKQWLSYNYNNIGATYQELGNNNAAITYLKKSLKIKEELGDDEGLPPTLENLANSCAALGNYKEAFQYLKRNFQIRGELENAEKERMAQELEARFNNEKKEAEINALKAEQSLQKLIIDGQKKDLQHQEELRGKEKNLIYALGVIMLSLIVTVFVFWRNNRERKKHNEELELKNQEIEKVNIAIETARTNLEYKNQEITDSINYAKRIQAAILPSEKTLDSHLNESFVLYLPKDIVAGDFYWTERIDDTILFAVADCTGHGVPGAMVSVICHNALNTTIKQMGLTDPGKILDETTQLVLRQFEKSEQEVRDGMDIALCSFNVKSRELRYAGANTPLWIVRGDETIKHKATRQPVGNHTQRTNFESNVIPVEKGDTIYLSSDGYMDQFGGEKGKKFLNKRFRELLIRISKKPIKTQADLLHDTFFTWKKGYEQVDDVCVMGVRVEH